MSKIAVHSTQLELQGVAPIYATVDAAGTLSNLEHIFSNNKSCLNELLQNARRAGATLCEIQLNSTPTINEGRSDITNTLDEVVIHDNGSGITDFSKLFNFSNSGWDESVKIQENCFGAGFFSTLFFSSTVTVESRGVKHTFTKESILSGTNISGGSSVSLSDVKVGTKITLINPHLKNTDNIAESLKLSCVAMPFNVRLQYNSYQPTFENNFRTQPISSIDSLEYIQKCLIECDEMLKPIATIDVIEKSGNHYVVNFDYGTVFIPKEKFYLDNVNILSATRCFLQGMPVTLHNARLKLNMYNYKNIDCHIHCHLNDNVPATHPDRMFIHDNYAAKVTDSLVSVVSDFCFELYVYNLEKALSGSDEDRNSFILAEYDFMSNNERLVPLMSRLNAVHSAEFSVLDELHEINTHDPYIASSSISTDHTVLNRKDLIGENPLVIKFDSREVTHNYSALFLTKYLDRPVYIVNDNFNCPQWLASYFVDFEDCVFSVEAVAPLKAGDKYFTQEIYQSGMYEQKVIFCPEVMLNIKSDGFNFSGSSSTLPLAIYDDVDDCNDERTLYIPYSISHEDLPSIDCILLQQDEYQNIIEHTCHLDFQDFLTINLNQDVSAAFISKIENLLKTLNNTRLGDYCQSQPLSLLIEDGKVKYV